MLKAFKLCKCFLSTTTPHNVGSYKFNVKKIYNINMAILGATESHAVPIKTNGEKLSIKNKKLQNLTKNNLNKLVKSHNW